MSSIHDVVPSFDITIKGIDDVANINKLIKSIFAKENVTIDETTELKGGLSNVLLKVCFHTKASENFKVIIRIYGEATSDIIDRFHEKVSMCGLHQLGSQQQLHGIFSNGVCYSFIEGHNPKFEQMWEEPLCNMIADEMALMHSYPTKSVFLDLIPANQKAKYQDIYSKPVLFYRTDIWIKKLPKKIPNLEARIKNYPPLKMAYVTQPSMLEELKFVKKLLIGVDSPLALCHNDIIAENIIVSKCGKKLAFIDLEFCGFNHAAFDIADHFCEYSGVADPNFEHFPKPDYQRKWITRYLASCARNRKEFAEGKQHGKDVKSTGERRQSLSSFEPSKKEVDHWIDEVMRFTLASHLLWAAWAFIRTTDVHDYDFLNFALKRLQEYYRYKPFVLKTIADSSAKK